MRGRIGIGIAVIVAAVALAAILIARCGRGGGDRASTGSIAGSGGAGGGLAGAGAGGALGATGADGTGTSAHAAHAALSSWLVRAGAKPKRIAGRVLFEGAPVAGAEVRLHSFLHQITEQPQPELKSGADGTFDFGLLPVLTYEVSASVPGKIAAIVRVDLADPTQRPAPDRLELVLGACVATVAGTVFDATGTPIPRARVQRRAGQTSSAALLTDERGAYELCVPHGNTELEFGADAYGSVILGVTIYGPTRQDVVLVPEAVITGRVIRADGGAPVAGAIVGVSPKEWARDRPAPGAALTGADGRFRIDALAPTTYHVWATADGFRTERPVQTVATVGTGADVEIQITASASIRGVVMRAGQPVGGAKVRGIRTSPVGYTQPSVSLEDGTFELTHVPLGDIAFAAAPYAVSAPATFRADQPKRYEGVVVEITQQGAIRGTVTRLGKPIAGVEVCCINTGQMSNNAVSDEAGVYEFQGVPAGDYDLYAESQTAGAFAYPKKVKVAQGETREVDFELNFAATISGVVVDKRGAPVPHVFVTWKHDTEQDLCRSVTDAAGTYRCPSMTGGGTYRASVHASPTSPTPFPTADGAPYPAIKLEGPASLVENVRIAIDRQDLAIAGRVVDSAGAGLADVRVMAAERGAGPDAPRFPSWQKLATTYTAEDGSFRLTGLGIGAHAVRAIGVDGSEGTVDPVQAGATGVTVKIARAGTIAGTLVGFPQPPVIYAVPVAGAHKLNAAVVDGTTFRVTGLRAGRYTVNGQTTYEGDSKIVEVREGETVAVTLTAKGRGAIAGTVLDWRTRAPIPGITCHVVMSAEGTHGVTNWDPAASPKSDAAGKIVFDPAPAGTIHVECMAANMRRSPPSADLTLAAGARAELTLYTIEFRGDRPMTIGAQLDYGAVIPRFTHVVPGGPAARAGIAIGDVVTAVDGAAIEGLNAAGVQTLILDRAAGSNVKLTVQSGAAKKTVTVKIDAEPA